MPAHISQNGASRMLDLVPLGRPRLPAALLGLLVVLGLVVAGSPAARAAGTGVHAVAAQPDACPPVTFARTQLDASAGRVVGVAAADVNGDGAPDLQALVSAEGFGINALYDFRADGLGGFSAPTVYDDIRPDPLTIEAGDFNGDGRDDIATANFWSRDVSVLLQTATGFAPAVNRGVAGQPQAVATGDFNEDGRLDLATASFQDRVSVLLGDGSGGFVRLPDLAVGGNAQAMTSGDFNRDGRVDLAVASQSASNVSLLLGDGTGDFAPPASYLVGNGPRSITSADFNGDGLLDLATGNFDNGTVSVLLNTSRAENAVPSAGGDAYDVKAGGTLEVAAPGVLANDRDADCDVLSAEPAGGPAHGTLDLRSDGSFSYTPEPGYRGPDAFSYRADDGSGSTVAEVSLNVSRVATTDDRVTVIEGSGGDTVDVLANDTRVGGGTLTVSAVTQPRYGSVAIIDGGAAVSYTPVADHVGPDPFTYTATDADGDTATARVSLTVAPARGCVTAGFGAPRSFSVARLTDSTQ